MMEVKRKVSTVSITEDGLFHQNQIPGDYTGPHLDIDVVHAIVFADESGNLMTFTCSAPVAMDSSRSPKAYDPGQMTVIEAPVAETFGSGSEYSHRLPQSVKTKVDQYTTLIESDGASKVLP